MSLLTHNKSLLAVFSLIISIGLSAQPPKAVSDSSVPLRLFLIGNSFSQNATRYLPQLAAAGGHRLVIGRAELGGCPLQRHWESVEAANANPDDPKGKPYSGKSLKMLLSEGTWDVVTIQQYSLISGDVNTYQPFAKKLYDFIKSLQPAAKIVFHQTWEYRSDADGFGRVNGTVVAKNQQEMYEKSRDAYRTVAKALGIAIIPTGNAFHQVDTDPAWHFKRDSSFNYSAAVYPQLPDQTHSLHAGYSWNKSKKLSFDSHHASIAGCYLGGLVWYTFLFNESPVKNPFKPAEVDEPFAAYLKETADKAVKQGKRVALQ